jgi:hypothetical protein
VEKTCTEQMTVALDELTAQVKHLNKIIEGNGEPGLKEQAMLNTNFRIRGEKFLDDFTGSMLKWWCASMLTIFAIVFAVVKMLVD